MISNLKGPFTNFNNSKNYLKLNKKGAKFYINSSNDIYLKKNYKSNKYIFGYNYNIKFYNFNSLCILFKIIYKQNKEYASITKYVNLFNNKFLFINKNDI